MSIRARSILGVLLVLLLLVLISCTGDGGPTPPPPFPVEQAPVAYHVVYNVEIAGGFDQVEERWVRRPYLGRTDIKKPDGEIISSFITNRDGFFIYSNGEYHLAEPGRHRSASDVRPLEALRFGERLGYVRRTGAETHAGKRCTTAVLPTPTGSALTSTMSGREEVLCVGEAGIALRDESLDAGRRTRQAVAERFEGDGSFSDDVFVPPRIGEPFPSEVEVREIDPATITFPLWRLPPSSTFTLATASLRLETSDLGGERISLVLFYERGADLVEVEQALRGGARWDTTEGISETIPGVGQANLIAGLARNEVRFPLLPEEGVPRQVALRSLLSPGDLKDLAAHLAKSS